MKDEVLAYKVHVHMCGSREYWPMAPGQEHCEKAEWTCLKLVQTSWVAKQPGKHDNREKETEVKELEDVEDDSGVQYGASSGKEPVKLGEVFQVPYLL